MSIVGKDMLLHLDAIDMTVKFVCIVDVQRHEAALFSSVGEAKGRGNTAFPERSTDECFYHIYNYDKGCISMNDCSKTIKGAFEKKKRKIYNFSLTYLSWYLWLTYLD